MRRYGGRRVGGRNEEHGGRGGGAEEEEKRQELVRQQEKALLAQLQLDEETGEFVPRSPPALGPTRDAGEPSEITQVHTHADTHTHTPQTCACERTHSHRSCQKLATPFALSRGAAAL